MQVVISNTTEVGIQLVEDNIGYSRRFLSRVNYWLFYWRAIQAFNGDKTKGLVIVPTELIPDNGTKLKDIVTELAQQHQLDAGFMQWLNESNIFCNTLVDRIVPGKPDAETLAPGNKN